MKARLMALREREMRLSGLEAVEEGSIDSDPEPLGIDDSAAGDACACADADTVAVADTVATQSLFNVVYVIQHIVDFMYCSRVNMIGQSEWNLGSTLLSARIHAKGGHQPIDIECA